MFDVSVTNKELNGGFPNWMITATTPTQEHSPTASSIWSTTILPRIVSACVLNSDIQQVVWSSDLSAVRIPTAAPSDSC
jgi:hypothetical protein